MHELYAIFISVYSLIIGVSFLHDCRDVFIF